MAAERLTVRFGAPPGEREFFLIETNFSLSFLFRLGYYRLELRAPCCGRALHVLPQKPEELFCAGCGQVTAYSPTELFLPKLQGTSREAIAEWFATALRPAQEPLAAHLLSLALTEWVLRLFSLTSASVGATYDKAALSRELRQVATALSGELFPVVRSAAQ